MILFNCYICSFLSSIIILYSFSILLISKFILFVKIVFSVLDVLILVFYGEDETDTFVLVGEYV